MRIFLEFFFCFLCLLFAYAVNISLTLAAVRVFTGQAKLVCIVHGKGNPEVNN